MWPSDDTSRAQKREASRKILKCSNFPGRKKGKKENEMEGKGKEGKNEGEKGFGIEWDRI